VAARGIALGFLQAAEQARRRLRDRGDDEALHDFRVALRRFRSTIRLYRPWLGAPSLPRKLRRRLRRLARTTNAARDAEVGLAWMRRQSRFMPRRARTGVQWFVDELESRRQAAYEDIHTRALSEFDDLLPRLRVALRAPRRRVSLPPLRTVIGDLMAKQIAALDAELARIRSVDDAETIHAARIEAKRLRYLIEPLVAGRADGKRCVQSLKDFQDTLGTFCDRTALARELLDTARRVGAERAEQGIDAAMRGQRTAATPDRLPALASLSAHAQAQRLRGFRLIRRNYLGDRTETFLAPFRLLAHALAQAPRARGARGVRTGSAG
jgi:CHAD domain-containing protein